MMQNSKSAIIIGAGIGGIATAIFLARQGYQVRIYEKNASPGGRCGQIIRDGHRFDLGATILAMPSVYRQVFESLGLDFDTCFTITPLDNFINVNYSNGEEIAFTTNQNRMQSQLETIEPGSYRKFQKYIAEGTHFFRISLQQLLGRNFYRFFDFINIHNALLLIRLKSYRTHYNYIGRYFKHPHLKIAFTFQNIYVGQSPFKAPAFFSMLPSVELTEGSLFLKGGMYSIVDKLVSTAVSNGVQFFYKKSVSRIAVTKQKATGIELADGTFIPSEIIIANADLPYVYTNLLNDKRLAGKINKLKYACSAIVFHWGLDKIYPVLDHHNVFFSKDYLKCMHKIFNDKTVDDPPSFYVHAPTRTDKSAAPENQDSISIVIPVGHIDPTKDQPWPLLKSNIKKKVIERLQEAGLTDIGEHIKFEVCYLPNTWESSLNISKGAVFGSLNHNIRQMGYFRPHNRHHTCRNLYFVGGSTHPGNGVPLVLLSAKLVSERILKDNL